MVGERAARLASGIAVPDAFRRAWLGATGVARRPGIRRGSADPWSASAQRGLCPASRCRMPSAERGSALPGRAAQPGSAVVAPTHGRRARSAACVRHRGAGCIPPSVARRYRVARRPGIRRGSADPWSASAQRGLCPASRCRMHSAERGSALPGSRGTAHNRDPAWRGATEIRPGSADPWSASAQRGLRPASRCRMHSAERGSALPGSRADPGSAVVAPTHGRRARSAACVRHRSTGCILPSVARRNRNPPW